MTSGINQNLNDAAVSDSILFAVGDGGTIVMSGDFGSTWSIMSSPVSSSIDAVSMGSINSIYIASNNIYYSADGGVSWSSQGQYNVTDVCVKGQQGCYAKTDEVHETQNGGILWSMMVVIPGGGDHYIAAEVIGSAMFLMGNTDYNSFMGFRRTTDHQWRPLHGSGNFFDHLDAITFLTEDEALAFTTNSDSTINSLYRISNFVYDSIMYGFIFWDYTHTAISNNLPERASSAVFINDSIGLYASTGGNIYATLDGGATWQLDYQGNKHLSCLISVGDSSFIAVGDSGIILKRNGLPSIANCHADFLILPDSFATGLYWGYNLSTGNNLQYSWSWGDGSTDSGEYPSHTYADSGFYTICLTVLDTFSLCTDTFCADYSILKTSGMTGIHQLIFVAYPVAVPVHNSTQPEWKIFPNPFSSSATIEFTLDHPSPVTIKLFSVNGKEMNTIAESNFSEGSHEVNFNRASLAAGIYFLHFITSRGVYRKKLVIE